MVMVPAIDNIALLPIPRGVSCSVKTFYATRRVSTRVFLHALFRSFTQSSVYATRRLRSENGTLSTIVEAAQSVRGTETSRLFTFV